MSRKKGDKPSSAPNQKHLTDTGTRIKVANIPQDTSISLFLLARASQSMFIYRIFTGANFFLDPATSPFEIKDITHDITLLFSRLLNIFFPLPLSLFLSFPLFIAICLSSIEETSRTNGLNEAEGTKFSPFESLFFFFFLFEAQFSSPLSWNFVSCVNYYRHLFFIFLLYSILD